MGGKISEEYSGETKIYNGGMERELDGVRESGERRPAYRYARIFVTVTVATPFRFCHPH